MLKKLTDKRKRLEQAPSERIAYIPPCYWHCLGTPENLLFTDSYQFAVDNKYTNVKG